MGVWIFDNTKAMSRVAASLILQSAQRAVSRHGMCAVALSGGHTPLEAYTLLANTELAHEMPWDKLHLFWGDERCVPPNHPHSNFAQAASALGRTELLKPRQVHRILAEKGPEEAADQYEQELREFAAAHPEKNRLFDLVLLGMGADGHTASLFPGSRSLEEKDRWVVAAEVPRGIDPPVARVTLTFNAICNTSRVVFMVAGADKLDAAARAIKGDQDLPAGRVQPKGELIWLMDRAAAGEEPAV